MRFCFLLVGAVLVSAPSFAQDRDACTVAKCRQLQGKEGWTPAETMDWCSRNVTNRGASAWIPVPKAGAKK
jgi:hypothetical protein